MSNEASSAPAVAQQGPPPTNPAAAQLKERRFWRGELGQVPVVITLIVIALYFQIASGGFFLVPRNLSNLFLQIATIASLALASVLVLLIAEIDLSLAAVASLCGAVMVTLSVFHSAPAWVALLAGLVAGAVIGAINGFFVAVMRIPSFILTLAGLIFYQGLLEKVEFPNTTIRLNDSTLTGIATNYLPDWAGVTIPIVIVAVYIAAVLLNRAHRARHGLPNPPTWELGVRLGVVIVLVLIGEAIFEGFLGVPISTAIILGLILLFWLILRFTPFGRHVYAVGGNAEAARRAGINTTTVRIAVFALASTLAAVGGILEASRTGAAATQVDNSLLLDAIAAAVIGGVSLFGGRGSAWAVVLGSLVIGSLANGLALLNQEEYVKLMVEGAVLLIAVLADAIIRRRSAVSGR